MLEGIVGVQKEAVLAAKRSIVTVEEMVEDFGPRSPNAVILPAWTVGAICARAGRRLSLLCATAITSAHNAFYKAWDAISQGPRQLPRLDQGERAGAGSGGVRRPCAHDAAGGGVDAMADYTPTEMMTVAAARALRNDDVCFVGIGMPSAAANLARLTHAPDITLIYESGTLGTQPNVLPLSIGDGELCETALTTVSVPEMFRYWLQGGRITVGFLGGAQIDRFANLNTTVVGPYDKPKRAPARRRRRAGDRHLLRRDFHHHGAEQARASCDQARFRHLARPWRGRRPSRPARRSRPRGRRGSSPTWRCSSPIRETREMVVTAMHPGVTREQIADATGWPVRFARYGRRNTAASAAELEALRELHARTARAHATRPNEKQGHSNARRLSSATRSARRSAATAARWPACAPTTWRPCRSRR